MNMWGFIIIAVISVSAAGLLYISFRTAGIEFIKKACGGRKLVSVPLCAVLYALLTAALAFVWDIFNALICMLHLYVFWLISELAAFVIRKIRKTSPSRVWECVSAFVLCASYLTYGWFAVHNVRQTEYAFTSQKVAESLRIVQFSDSHIGATFDAEGFKEHIETINSLQPDCVVITGDFVDDGTTREQMLASCDALAALKTTYGVFLVWGNHDRGYYKESRRGWSYSELRERLIANGVTVLEDECVCVGGSYCIAGRRDRSDRSRKSAWALMQEAETDRYVIMLDHQPNDFDPEAASGADLVLCGHTHGGQFIPILHVGEWIGENDLRYGHEKRGDTDFIVSSGISNWEFKFKTGCFSEIVVIDITPE